MDQFHKFVEVAAESENDQLFNMACHVRMSQTDDKAWKKFVNDYTKRGKIKESKKRAKDTKMTPLKMAALNSLLSGKMNG